MHQNHIKPFCGIVSNVFHYKVKLHNFVNQVFYKGWAERFLNLPSNPIGDTELQTIIESTIWWLKNSLSVRKYLICATSKCKLSCLQEASEINAVFGLFAYDTSEFISEKCCFSVELKFYPVLTLEFYKFKYLPHLEHVQSLIHRWHPEGSIHGGSLVIYKRRTFTFGQRDSLPSYSEFHIYVWTYIDVPSLIKNGHKLFLCIDLWEWLRTKFYRSYLDT